MYGWLELDGALGARAYAHAQCGLCAFYGRTFRTRTRLLAAADPTLLVMFLEALAPEPPAYTRVRCPLTLKLTKRHALAWEPLEIVAELQLVLASEKLIDDRLDKDGMLTRVASSLLAKDLAAAEARLVARGFPVEALRLTLRRQTALEADPASDLDTLCAPTAEGLALIAGWLAAHLGLDAPRVAAAAAFAGTLGRLLYMVDALNDLAADRARGRFNPLDAALGALSPRRMAWLGAHLDGLVRTHAAGFEALALERHADALRAAFVTRLSDKATVAFEALASRPSLAAVTP